MGLVDSRNGQWPLTLWIGVWRSTGIDGIWKFIRFGIVHVWIWCCHGSNVIIDFARKTGNCTENGLAFSESFAVLAADNGFGVFVEGSKFGHPVFKSKNENTHTKTRLLSLKFGACVSGFLFITLGVPQISYAS